jgi:ABC-type xylose transport system permease subunit
MMGLRRQPQRLLAPLVGLLVSTVFLFLALTQWGPQYAGLSSDDPLRWPLVAVVFVSVGLFMAGIAWLSTAVLNVCGASARLPFAATMTAGVVFLIGWTPLPSTVAPMPMLIMIGLALLSGLLLNHTIWGRYLLALGNNEEAARFSGINTDRMIIMAYVICSGAAGLGGVLFALDINSVQPSGHGNFYELYAIAAAVLGGCSLRGGEGTILGVVIGAAVMRVLYNSINILGIQTQLEFSIIGFVILAGVIVDELVKRFVARRRAVAQARELTAAQDS